MNYLAAIFIGYCLGCINPAYFMAKMKGFDIRTRGTGNCGASNAKVTMGWPAGVIVAVYDAFKAVASFWICMYLFQDLSIAVIAGASAIIGHCYPFYLQFKGGKGFASLMGLSFVINWKYFLIMLAIGIVLTVVTNWIVTATFTCTLSLPIYSFITNKPMLVIIVLSVIAINVFYMHRNNIRKFVRKREIGLNGKAVGIKLIHDDKFKVAELQED